MTSSLGVRMGLLVIGLGMGAQAAELSVVVSIPPLLPLVQRLGGGHVKASAFMDETQDPHTYSPSPRAVAGLGKAQVFFTTGADFEEALCAKLKRMFPALEIVDLAEGIPSCVVETAAGLGGFQGAEAHAQPAGHAAHDHGHDHHHHDHDPHVWLSLNNLGRMSGIVAEVLSRRLPDRQAEIAANHAALKNELESLHREFGSRLQSMRGKAFYIYHPALGHFAGDYGLLQRAVEIDGKSPSPRQLSALVDQARADGVTVIFVQPQFPQRAGNILAERIGGRVVAVNPVSADPVGQLRLVVDALSPAP